jgi:hypothetical protein
VSIPSEGGKAEVNPMSEAGLLSVAWRDSDQWGACPKVRIQIKRVALSVRLVQAPELAARFNLAVCEAQVRGERPFSSSGTKTFWQIPHTCLRSCNASWA